MGTFIQKSGNLVKLLDGLSLLDDRDTERFAAVVDTLERTDRTVSNALFSDDPLLKLETSSVYTDDEI